MTARLSRIKDHRTLLRAFRLVAANLPNVVLELIGDGELRGDLELQAMELGVSSRVRFLGDVQNVFEVIRRWDLFAYATTAREGLGNAVAEAMAMGLPCVLTDVGPMREFGGSDGRAARLVEAGREEPLARAIVEMLMDHALRSQMSLDASAFATETFDPKKFSQLYLSQFNVPSVY